MPLINTFFKNTKLSAIKEILNSISKTEGVISLAWGLPDYSLDETIKNDLIKEIENNPRINKYPPFKGLGVLVKKIIETIKVHHQLRLTDGSVLICAGAMEALHSTFQTILNVGDEVIVVTPTYSSHFGQIQLLGAKIVPVTLDEKNRWRLDIAKVKNAITSKTKAILFTSPNNPTGTVYDKSILQKLIQLTEEKDIFLVSDETYQFLYYGDKPISILDFAKKSHVIVVRSLSKEFAMTGFRIGYVVADEKLIHEMYKAHDSAVGFPATISEYAAYFALDHFPKETALFYAQDYREKKDLIMRELQKYSKVLRFVPPLGAYYIFVRYNLPIKSFDLVKELLLKAKVGVVPGVGFGEGGEHHIRLSFAGVKKDIVEGVKRMGDYLSKP